MPDGIPSAVRKRAEEAEKLQKEAQAAADPEGAAPPQPEDPEAPKAPELEQPELLEPDEAPPQAEPEAPQEPQEPEEEPDPRDAEIEALKHKNKVLQGKYDAEVPRLAKERNEAIKRNEELELQLASQQIQEPAAPAEAPVVDYKKYATEEELEEFGEDYVALQANIAARMMNEQLAKIQGQLETVKRSSEDATFDAFEQSVAAAVPNFNQLNTDPEFIEWLQQPDGYSGGTLQDSLDDASVARDLNRVVSIFKAWEATRPKETGKKVTPMPLEQQVSPKGKGAPQNPSKKTYTVSQYKEIAKNVALGRYTPEQAQELQRELDTAYAEGRIIAG